MSEHGAIAVGMIAGIAALVLIVWFCILLPADMARERNRDPLIWVLISLVGSPLLTILLLIALGEVAPSSEEAKE